MKVWAFLVVFLSLPVSLFCQSVDQLAGSWRLLQFSVPQSLSLTFGTNNELNNIEGLDDFRAGTGLVIMQADGSFTAVVQEPATGHASLSGQGAVTIYLDGDMSFPFRVNSQMDFMGSAAAEESGSYALQLLTKAPTTFSQTLVSNTSWTLYAFQTPSQLNLEQRTNGPITGVIGATEFGHRSGTLVLDGKGGVSGSMGEAFAGSYSYEGSGLLTVRINTPTETMVLPWFINAAEDILMSLEQRTDSEGGIQSVMLGVRPPVSAQVSELAGVWHVVSLSTPNPLSVVTGSDGLVTDLYGWNSFGADLYTFTVGDDGFFTGQFDEPTSGTLSLTGPGDIQVSLPDETLHFKLNASKNFAVGFLGQENEQELAIFVKAPPALSNRQNFGLRVSTQNNSILIEWAAGDNRVIEQSSDLVTWEAIPETAGQHSFSTTASAGTRIFRVAEGQ